MSFATTDITDKYADQCQVAEPLFADYGGNIEFHGPIATLKLFEDNSLVRESLEQPGKGRVLVVDGGGSMRCALLGDQLAALGVKNGWAGVVVNGCIRDSSAIVEMAIGVKALATHPLKSLKKGIGERDLSVRFAGVSFQPGHYLYADADGIVVSEKLLQA